MKWSGNINYLNKVLQQFEQRLIALEKEVEELKKKPEPKRGPGRPRKVEDSGSTD